MREVRAMPHDWEFNGLGVANARHSNEERPDRGRFGSNNHLQTQKPNDIGVMHIKLPKYHLVPVP